MFPLLVSPTDGGVGRLPFPAVAQGRARTRLPNDGLARIVRMQLGGGPMNK